LPLVSDFLDAGVGAVLYSLWPVGETEAAAFADEFYARLDSDPDIVRALADIRQAAFDPDRPANSVPNSAEWAGFQLFIR
jgi:CHAT domain-containing protein